MLPTLLTLAPALLSDGALTAIARGRVYVEPNWIPPALVSAMCSDAKLLKARGMFSPDGLTNTAKVASEQGFSVADRQTFRNDAWDADIGDLQVRLEFAQRMGALRAELARGLDRPTLAPEGTRKHEITYNWYEPGAKLGRHLDEHHEETKGSKGWLMPTRRSVTWLVYLNDGWKDAEGGALRCFPRRAPSDGNVGADAGNLQVGWLDGAKPVFLDSTQDADRCFLYSVEPKAPNGRRVLSAGQGFAVPPKPVEFRRFLRAEESSRFEQISTARLDPRFASGAALSDPPPPIQPSSAPEHFQDVVPAAGTLVVFDSVSMPHEVLPVTAQRSRVAATGWFHEDLVTRF